MVGEMHDRASVREDIEKDYQNPKSVWRWELASCAKWKREMCKVQFDHVLLTQVPETGFQDIQESLC